MKNKREIGEVDKVILFLRARNGYLKTGDDRLALILKVSPKSVKTAKKLLKIEISNKVSSVPEQIIYKSEKTVKKPIYNPFNKDNVLFIPDLHAPFIKKGVLEWIKYMQGKYDCGTVIFAGDIIDGHAWSYHEHDVDGMSVGDELNAAKKQLQEWYTAFPEAICLLGNHDLLIQRKAKTAGLSKQFIRDFGSVIGAPDTWEFKLEHILNNILYHHGSIGDAFTVAKNRRISTCQGHLHSKSFIQWSVSEKDSIFGLQIGWGADRDKYAFDYGKSFVMKPILSCGIILDKGRTPIVELMPL